MENLLSNGTFTSILLGDSHGIAICMEIALEWGSTSEEGNINDLPLQFVGQKRPKGRSWLNRQSSLVEEMDDEVGIVLLFRGPLSLA